jgi:hypothetical protein
MFNEELDGKIISILKTSFSSQFSFLYYFLQTSDQSCPINSLINIFFSVNISFDIFVYSIVIQLKFF